MLWSADFHMSETQPPSHEHTHLSPAQLVALQIFGVMELQSDHVLPHRAVELALFLRANGLTANTIQPVIDQGMTEEPPGIQAVLAMCADQPEPLTAVDALPDTTERDSALVQWATYAFDYFPDQIIDTLRARGGDSLIISLLSDLPARVINAYMASADRAPSEFVRQRDMERWAEDLFTHKWHDGGWHVGTDNYTETVNNLISHAKILQTTILDNDR